MIIIYTERAAEVQFQLRHSFLIGKNVVIYRSRDIAAARFAAAMVAGRKKKPKILNLTAFIEIILGVVLCVIPGLVVLHAFQFHPSAQFSLKPLSSVSALLIGAIVVAWYVYGYAILTLMSPSGGGRSRMTLKIMTVASLTALFFFSYFLSVSMSLMQR